MCVCVCVCTCVWHTVIPYIHLCIRTFFPLVRLVHPPPQPTTDLSSELSEVRQGLLTAVNKWQSERPITEIETDQDEEFNRDSLISELILMMERKKLYEAVNKLHYFRRKWRNEAFGQSDEDDLDVLFYMYAHYLAERQEGPGQSGCSVVGVVCGCGMCVFREARRTRSIQMFGCWCGVWVCMSAGVVCVCSERREGPGQCRCLGVGVVCGVWVCW